MKMTEGILTKTPIMEIMASGDKGIAGDGALSSL
jgi:hypothetical protein